MLNLLYLDKYQIIWMSFHNRRKADMYFKKGLKIIWWEKLRKKVRYFSIIVYVHTDIWQFSLVSVKQIFSFHWGRGKVISICFAVISEYLEVRMCLRIGRARQLVCGNLLHKSKSAICWSSVLKIYHAVQILPFYVCWFFKWVWAAMLWFAIKQTISLGIFFLLHWSKKKCFICIYYIYCQFHYSEYSKLMEWELQLGRNPKFSLLMVFQRIIFWITW